jgi:serine protease Do
MAAQASLPSRRRVWPTALALIASFLLGGWVLPHLRWDPEPEGSRAAPVVQASPAIAAAADEPIARAAARVSPAVVNIDTVSRVAVGIFGDEVLDEFFGRRTVRRTGSGSGVIIDNQGHILTNEHVVADADEINVTLVSGRKYSGRVVGKDHATDVALVKVSGEGLPVAPLGSSERLMPGQWAIAIGNPYGFQHTVTVGVVSNTGRPVRVGDRSYEKLIQTDAAINPGNSGGPLVDGKGQVIGINTMVLADAQGIGFAIPIDLARSLAQELIRSGKIKRPWTGMFVRPVTPEIAAYLGLRRAEGVIVDHVAPDSPARAAGIRRGDIVVELGRRRIASQTEYDAVLKSLKIGDRLRVIVRRGPDLLEGEITITEAPP